MKIKTIIIAFLLFLICFGAESCKTEKIPVGDEAVQKALAKKEKKEGRAARKLQKQREKHYWSLQSKEVRKSLKKNRKYQKRKARKLRKNDHFNDN